MFVNPVRSAHIPLVLLFSIAFMCAQPAWAQRLKIGLFIDRGTEAIDFKKEFARSNDICKYLSGDDIRDGALRNFDVLVVPGGSASKESMSMGVEARDQIRRFVHDGGIYMGVCAGAYLASQMKKFYLGFIPVKVLDEEHWYRTAAAPLIPVELTPCGMDIFGIKNKIVSIKYENGPIFALPNELGADGLTPLGYFREEVVASGGERGVMKGAPFAIMSKYGRGTVLVISPHPEETDGLKTAELHAIHWLYSHRDVPNNAAGSGLGGSTRAIADASVIEANKEAGKMQGTTDSGVRTDDSELGDEAVRLAQTIFEHATEVRYCHKEKPASRQIVTYDDGAVEANTDCSGFISYIVHKIAPRHYRAVRSREPGHSYPQAKVWARFFDTLDGSEPRDGWLGITDWRQLRPGDLIAWKEGKAESKNTGHVMMVFSKPSAPRQEGGVRFIEVAVIDSSSVYHFAPEHLPPNAHQNHRNGLGMGNVRIVLSDEGKPIGYWAGTYWGEGHKDVTGPTLSNMVRFARMVPLSQG
jgi:putative intracellular protease/amidase